MNQVLKLVKQGLFYPYRFIAGRRKASTVLAGIKNGSGAVIDFKGKKVAVYKDQKGKVYAHSAVCTHLGCIIGWDDAKKEWECPCHGSQYDINGKVLRGPTKRDLPEVKLP